MNMPDWTGLLHFKFWFHQNKKKQKKTFRLVFKLNEKKSWAELSRAQLGLITIMLRPLSITGLFWLFIVLEGNSDLIPQNIVEALFLVWKVVFISLFRMTNHIDLDYAKRFLKWIIINFGSGLTTWIYLTCIDIHFKSFFSFFYLNSNYQAIPDHEHPAWQLEFPLNIPFLHWHSFFF